MVQGNIKVDCSEGFPSGGKRKLEKGTNLDRRSKGDGKYSVTVCSRGSKLSSSAEFFIWRAELG
jgi:hypothetical protein